MPVIKAPNDNPRDDDLERQQALEPSFLLIIEEAVAVGAAGASHFQNYLIRKVAIALARSAGFSSAT